MSPAILLALAGVALLAAEMAVPGILLLWIGLAVLATALFVEVSGAGWLPVTAVFVGALAASVGLGLFLQRRQEPSRVNLPEGGLVGREGRVASASAAGLRIRLGDSEWEARAEARGHRLSEGEVVVVTGVDGTTLRVRRAPGGG